MRTEIFQFVDEWDAKYFDDFVAIRNRIYATNPVFLRESSASLRQMLARGAPFGLTHAWRAWIARDSSAMPVGRVLVSYPRSRASAYVSLGYFEALDPDTARGLFREAEAWVRELGFAKIRGPIQGSFFNNYRMKLPGGAKPFFREPLYRDEYHEFFRQNGYRVVQEWNTFALGRSAGLDFLKSLARRFFPGGENSPAPASLPDITTRSIDRGKGWARDLATMHALLTDCYSEMEEFTPITLEEFQVWFDPFKHLLQSKLCLLAEIRGDAVGFLISMRDPLWIFRIRQKLETFRWMPLTALNALTLALLRINRGRLLILWAGKKSALEGKVKGITARLAQRLARNTCFWPQSPWIAYVARNSPAHRTMPKASRPISTYVLYEKLLDR